VNRRTVVVGDRRGDQIVNYRKRESGRLAGSCLGEANEIPPFEREGNCLLLDRRWMRVTRIENGMQHFGREVELRKRDARNVGVDSLFNHLYGIYPQS